MLNYDVFNLTLLPRRLLLLRRSYPDVHEVVLLSRISVCCLFGLVAFIILMSERQLAEAKVGAFDIEIDVLVATYNFEGDLLRLLILLHPFLVAEPCSALKRPE